MLIMSRHRDEGFILGPNESDLIEIKIVEIRGDKVRIGIEAPPSWLVHRREVWDAIKRESTRKEEDMP